MTPTYTPQPGTIPFRVISHLKSLPAGTEIPTAELCEALALDISGPIGSYMVTAVKHGALRSSTRPVAGAARVMTFWSVGDGTPPLRRAVDEEPEEPEEPDEPAEPVTQPKSAWPFTPSARSVFDLAGASSQDEKPEAEPEPERLPQEAEPIVITPAPVPQTPPAVIEPKRDLEQMPVAETVELFQADDEDDSFACALWSDGRLQLQIVGEEMVLSVEQTRVLVGYLERMGVEA